MEEQQNQKQIHSDKPVWGISIASFTEAANRGKGLEGFSQYTFTLTRKQEGIEKRLSRGTSYLRTTTRMNKDDCNPWTTG
jgi:hypothetical protein